MIFGCPKHCLVVECLSPQSSAMAKGLPCTRSCFWARGSRTGWLGTGRSGRDMGSFTLTRRGTVQPQPWGWTPPPSRLPARRRRPFWRLVGRSEGGCYWHAESHVRQGRTCRGGRPGSAAECRSRRTRAAWIAAWRLSVDGRAMSPARSAQHGRLTADGQVPRVSVLPLPTIARPSFPSPRLDRKSPASVPRCVVVHAGASVRM